MRRLATLAPRLVAAAAALAAGCVTVEPPPNPRGSVRAGQRLVVLVYQAPGPWIVADPDSKAETALKFLPLGTMLQGMQEDRINELSQQIQPYLPRPRYGQELEKALIARLKELHDGPVQTYAEAGIPPAQLREWNRAADQLDWRRRYFAPQTGGAPRDYTKLLSLDDAIIVDVNVQFGLEPDEEERTIPTLKAATRLHRGDTSRTVLSREDAFTDKTSCMTLTEFRAEPAQLTDRLFALAAPLGKKAAEELATEAGLRAPPRPVTTIPEPPRPGLLPLEQLMPAASTGAPAAAPGGDGPPAPPPGSAPPPAQPPQPAPAPTTDGPPAPPPTAP